MTQNTYRAIKKYGFDVCKRAYELNEKEGEGASTVAIYLGLSGTRAADAAINAGREINKLLAIRKFLTILCS